MVCASLRTPMVRQVDVLVIGAGPGGYPAAIRAAQLGKRVLLVERDKLGGECLNYGCIPSKALIHTANLVHAIERAAERGVEIGTFYAKLGTRVVVIEILEQILPGTDPEAVRIVARRLQKLGIEVHTKSQARGWRVDKDQTVIDVLTPEGLIARRADCVLVTVGRRPNTDELNADRAGVEFAPRGYIKVDRQLRTSNPHVFAVGDVVGPPFLAHKATKEGLTAAEVIAGHPAELDYRALPAAIFTDPEIATVGLQEAEAGAQGRKVRIGKVPFAAIGRALTTGEYDGFVKLLADPSSNVLLGATIAGPDASDLISELSLGIEMGATIADIALTIHPHPTLPEAIMESAEAALGEAIHALNR